MVAVQITRGLAGLGTRQDLQAFQPKPALCPPRFLLTAAQTTSTLLIDRAFVTRGAHTISMTTQQQGPKKVAYSQRLVMRWGSVDGT